MKRVSLHLDWQVLAVCLSSLAYVTLDDSPEPRALWGPILLLAVAFGFLSSLGLLLRALRRRERACYALAFLEGARNSGLNYYEWCT